MTEFGRVNITLWEADALVLWAWLERVDFNALPIEHPAERQALVDLVTAFEVDTEGPWASPQAIEEARREVAKDMDL